MFNRQRKLTVDRAALSDFALAVSGRLSVREGFTIVLVSDRSMRRFYRQFVGKDQTTDVLSFPLLDPPPRVGSSPERRESAPKGSDSLAAGEGETYLGDILISVEAADRQKGTSLENELKLLAIHGILHLLGYDHTVDRGEMDRLEGRLRREFSLD